MKRLWIALIAMVGQEALATMGVLALPVAAPRIAEALSINPALLGAYSAVLYGVGMFSSVAGGNLAHRYGGIRMIQLGLGATAAGLALAAFGTIPAFAACAVLVAFGFGPLTPASTLVLSRVIPAGSAPMVYSLQKTAVPMGGLLAGALIPAFIIWLDWDGALLATGALCVAALCLLQLLAVEHDRHRERTYGISPRAIAEAVRTVVTVPDLRLAALGMFAFGGVQYSFLSFYVTYLTKGLGLGLGSAGAVLAASQAVAMASRVLWGWVATRRVRPRLVLAMLAFGMMLSAILAGVSRPEWPLIALLAVALMFGTTATGWNGVMLAEITRASPAGRVGEMTGGALFFGFAGSMSVPAVFGGLLDATEGDYAVCFGMVAVIAVVAGVLFLFSAGARRPRSDVPANGPRPVN